MLAPTSCLSPAHPSPVLPACVRGQEDPALSRSRIPIPSLAGPFPALPLPVPSGPSVYEHSPVSPLPQYLPHTCALQTLLLLRHPSLVLLPNGFLEEAVSPLPPTPALSPLQLRVTGFLSHCSTDTAFCFCF